MTDNNFNESTCFSLLKEIDFKCQKCSACCRKFPGAVYLTNEDINKIINYLKINKDQFLEKYCRGIDKNGKKIVSLKEKPNFDCIFWSGECLIYPTRPTQCVTYPFWPSIVKSKERWKEEANYCKGIDKQGNLTFKQKIKYYLSEKNAVYVEYTENH